MNDYIITVSELKKVLKNQTDILLIDVRSMQEHQLYNIGGVVIPLSDLSKHLDEFDKNKTIIVYCHAGVRSLMAVKMFLDAGFTSVQSLEGGVLAWQNEETTA